MDSKAFGQMLTHLRFKEDKNTPKKRKFQNNLIPDNAAFSVANKKWVVYVTLGQTLCYSTFWCLLLYLKKKNH